jgi:hypothetical protein
MEMRGVEDFLLVSVTGTYQIIRVQNLSDVSAPTVDSAAEQIRRSGSRHPLGTPAFSCGALCASTVMSQHPAPFA